MKKNREENKKDEQLSFKLEEPFSNNLYKIKNKFYFTSVYLQNQKFFLDATVWFLIIFTITSIIFQYNLIIENFKLLPDLIPIIKYTPILDRRLFIKEIIYVFPFGATLLLLLSTIIANRAYSSNKFLAVFTLLINLTSTILFQIALTHLIGEYKL